MAYNLAYEVNPTKMTIVDYSSLCYIYNLFLVNMFQIHIPRLVIPVERDDLFLDWMLKKLDTYLFFIFSWVSLSLTIYYIAMHTSNIPLCNSNF